MTAIYARGEVIDPLLKVPLERKKKRKEILRLKPESDASPSFFFFCPLRALRPPSCTASSSSSPPPLHLSIFPSVSPVLYLRAGACLKVFTNADFSSLIPLINCGYGRYDSLICSRVVVALFGGKLATGELRGPARRYQASSSAAASSSSSSRGHNGRRREQQNKTHTHTKKKINPERPTQREHRRQRRRGANNPARAAGTSTSFRPGLYERLTVI